jgi:hypothetical protein
MISHLLIASRISEQDLQYEWNQLYNEESEIMIRNHNNYYNEEIVLLLQGPIEFNTLNIIRYYKNILRIKIYLSTWEGCKSAENEMTKMHDCTFNYDIIGTLEKLCEKVIINDNEFNKLNIKDCGIQNRVCHLFSVHEGIKMINRHKGITLILIARTDHLFRSPSTITQLHTEMIRFSIKRPVKTKLARMVISSMFTRLDKINQNFHISDQWMFGYITDISNYWNFTTFSQFNINPYTAESHFAQLWALNNDIDQYSLATLLREFFVILDPWVLDYLIVPNDKVYSIPNLLSMKPDYKLPIDVISHYDWLHLLYG